MEQSGKMHKKFIIVSLACFLAISAEEFYSSKYDNVDVDEILGNPRLRNQYMNCYMERGPCLTGAAKFLKETFPEALVTKCRKCTQKQKEFFEKVTVWYLENEPEMWKQIVGKTIRDSQKKGWSPAP